MWRNIYGQEDFKFASTISRETKLQSFQYKLQSFQYKLIHNIIARNKLFI